jgi:DNA-binding MarR family transcriptional regulator
MPLVLIPHVHRATHRIALFLARSKEFKVSQAEAHILAHLISSGPCTVGELHNALAHRRSTLTSILDRLFERGLITRETSSADRRSFVIALTPEGKKVGKAVYESLRDLERRTLGNFRRDEIQTVAEILSALAGEKGKTSKGGRRIPG